MKHLTHVPSRTRPRPHACSCPSNVRCRVTRGTAAAGGVFSPSCFVLRDVRDLLVLEVEPRCRRVERTAFVNAKVVEEGPRLVGCARQRLVVDVDAARPRMQLPRVQLEESPRVVLAGLLLRPRLDLVGVRVGVEAHVLLSGVRQLATMALERGGSS